MRATLLRAEVTYGTCKIVGHTTIVTPEAAFIRTDEIVEIGSSIDVELSLGRVLAPQRFRGVVTEHRTHTAPGEFAGWWVTADPGDAHVLQGVLEISSSARELRVLMVEDSKMARDVFSFVSSINRGPTRVVLDAVPDVEVAWERLQGTRYHVVLVDYFLPTSTGAQLVERIRADVQVRALPVIGFSIGGGVARDAMLAAGVDLFLDKPVQPRDLLATFDQLSALGDEVAS